jgi:hypothetical protein
MARRVEQNRHARIEELGEGSKIELVTSNRDVGTLTASARVRSRNDVETGRSLTGLSIKTAGGRYVRLSGFEARTLYRILDRAVNG